METLNLAGASFRGFKIFDWNNFADIPFTLTSTSDPGGTGVSFGRSRITSKIELTNLIPGTTFLNGAPCLLAHEYDL